MRKKGNEDTSERVKRLKVPEESGKCWSGEAREGNRTRRRSADKGRLEIKILEVGCHFVNDTV